MTVMKDTTPDRGGRGGGGGGGDQDKDGPFQDRDPKKPGDGRPPAKSGGGSGGGGGGGGGYQYNWQDNTVYQAQETYFRLWGVYPPKGYIEALVRKGMNVFEIEEFERRKPSFQKTKTYEDEYSAYAKVFAQMMGRR